jgi:hypothetical protein
LDTSQLTSISIRQKVREHIASGELWVFEPAVDGIASIRYLFLTREVHDEIFSDIWADPEFSDRFPLLAADLELFVSGEMIGAAMDPENKAVTAFIARLSPTERGIWAIRSREPKPSIRIFGAFIEVDTFVVLRTELRGVLGGWGSKPWNDAIENAAARFYALFVPDQPLTGDNLDDYLGPETFPC